MNIVIGLLIPFLGTTLGAACVFFLKDELNPLVQKGLLGFASGVMVAASVWSLLIPAIDMSGDMEKFAFVPAAVGFALGMAFLFAMDRVIPHLHLNEEKPEGLPSQLKKTTMLVLAVTLHNIPEGITVASAVALSIGIAIQNFPEGAIISLPLKSEGGGRAKSFFCGMASGVVEPVAAMLTILLTGIVTPLLPYLLSFAAGAMLYVVVEELLPEASAGEHSDIGTIGFAAGFLVMMILDVALG